MKRIGIILTMLVVCFMLVACSFNSNESSVSSSGMSTESEETFNEFEIDQLKSGDTVSIVGQVAISLQDGSDTISVQVLRENDRMLLYRCQLKSEFLDEGKELELLDVVKIKGTFLNIMDLEQENTAIVVNLYDCEIFE